MTTSNASKQSPCSIFHPTTTIANPANLYIFFRETPSISIYHNPPICDFNLTPSHPPPHPPPCSITPPPYYYDFQSSLRKILRVFSRNPNYSFTDDLGSLMSYSLLVYTISTPFLVGKICDVHLFLVY